MNKLVKQYVIITYLVFWVMVMGLCGTASMVFHCSPVVMRCLSNVCAWSPTIVLLVSFKHWCNGESIKSFYSRAFSGKIKLIPALSVAVVTIGATLITVLIMSILSNQSFSSFWSLGTYPLWASILFSITTGPTGEESGWRGYLRPILNERYSYVKSCIIQGVIWAFWHTILWFVDSDFMGMEMLPYIVSNVIVMTGMCFLMNLVMNKYNNLFYSILIHFCFNFLYCFLQVDIGFYIVLSAIYIIIIVGCLFLHKRTPSVDKINR